MKLPALLLLCTVLVAIQAQKPIPIPLTNLTRVSGQWYVYAVYNQGYNNSQEFVDCIQWNVEISNSNGGHLLETVWPLVGDPQSLDLTFTPTLTNHGVWDFSDGTDVAWLAVDPIAYSWGLLGEENAQTAFLVSRNQNLSSTIVAAQFALLKQEGYLINNTNYYQLPMNNC